MAQTIKEYIAGYSTETLLDILKELTENVIPSSGFCHHQIRKINKAIDLGKLQINPSSYRHISMPTYSKLVFKEAASRYLATLELNTWPVTCSLKPTYHKEV